MTAAAQIQRPRRQGNATIQTRVRLKPETRADLIERITNPQLTLHETSILLRVSRATVRRYEEAGKLKCIWTPGGQRRFLWKDVCAFLKVQNT